MNKVLLACAVTALAATAFSPLDAREFKHSGCANAAEIEFPTDRNARKGSSTGARISGRYTRLPIPETPIMDPGSVMSDLPSNADNGWRRFANQIATQLCGTAQHQALQISA